MSTSANNPFKVVAGAAAPQMDANTALLQAAQNNALDQIRACISLGQDVNAADSLGRNGLMLALRAGHEEAAALLLHHGINPHHRAASGETALMIACRLQIDTIVERLARAAETTPNPGEHLDAQQEADGKTALMLAIEAGDGWAACRLARAGADARTLRDLTGATAGAKAEALLEGKAHSAFRKIIAAREERAAAEKKRVLAENVTSATVLSREIKPLKTLSFPPKKPGYPSPSA